MISTKKTRYQEHEQQRPSQVFLRHCLLVSFLFCFSMVTPNTIAATYYLDAINGNDSNPGTSSLPWKTVARAMTQYNGAYNPKVVAGDTVKLRTGNYTGYVEGYGGAVNRTDWVTYEADTGCNPVFAYIESRGVWGEPAVNSYLRFRGIIVDVNASGDTAIYCRDVNYLQFYDMNIIGAGYTHPDESRGILLCNTDNVIVNHCNIYGDGPGIGEGTSAGGIPYTGFGKGFDVGIDGGANAYALEVDVNVTITDCNIWSCGTGIGISGSKWNVSNNKVHHMTWDGIVLQQVNGSGLTDPVVISNNEIHTLIEYGEAHADAIQLSGYGAMNHVIIRGNILRYMDGDSMFCKGDITGLENTDWLIENNLVYDTMRAQGLDWTIRIFNCSDAVFRNNTIYGAVTGETEGTPPTKMTFSVFCNNIIQNLVLFTAEPDGMTIVEYENNNIIRSLPYGSMKGFVFGPNTVILNSDLQYEALFNNFDANDFTLASGSLAINFGNPNYGPATDILGKSRVGAPDAGCYEYITSDSNNHAPVLQQIGNKSVNENVLLTFTVSASDADGDTINYSAQNLPEGATFSSQTFSWTPNYNQAANHQVTFIASDGQAQDTETITITVNNVNQPPILAEIGNKSVNENNPLSFSINASDPDGDTITYSAQSLPSGAVFASQTFTWTPDYTRAGTYQVTFIASDGQAQDSKTITITVNNVNRAPVLSSIGNKSVSANQTLSFTVNATDPDGDTITYSANGLPSGATFANKTFSWTPNESQTGSFSVTFTASDGQLQDSEQITITVNSTDTLSPNVTNPSPAPDSIQVPLNSMVVLHVVDSGEGVDANSATIRVNDNTVYAGNTATYSSAYGECRRSGTKSDYAFTYQADELFRFNERIQVKVNAADLAGNVMNEYSYSFRTEMRSFGRNKPVGSMPGNLSEAKPATIRDSSNNIWTAWQAGQEGSRDIYIGKLADGAENFSTPLKITDNSADQCNPAIAVDDSDKIYVVWQDNRRGNWDIYLSTSSDGLIWSNATRVTDTNDNQVNPDIAIDNLSPNRAYIVWQDDRNGNQDIYIAASSNSFVTSTVSRITSNTANQIEPVIAVDSGNTVYVAWTDMRNGSSDIYAASSNSGAWTNVPIVNKAGNQSSPAIAAESTGSILHFLWVDDVSGNNDIYYVSSNGLPASPLAGSSIIDDSSGADQLEPVIAVAGSAGNNLRILACWQDKRNVAGNSGDTDLYFADIGGDSGTNVLVGDDGTNADQSEPAIGIDEYGNPYLVWTDSRNANSEIYYAGSTFTSPTAIASENVSISTGATVGTAPEAIDSSDDVSVIVPAGAYSCDIEISISKVNSPPAFEVDCLTLAYDFSPSGITFSEPVTITIPYVVSDSSKTPLAYWYDPLTGTLSHDGITDVRDLVITSTLHALQFKTTHFTQFIGGSDGGGLGGSGGGGGGCSLATAYEGNIFEFLLPYIGLAVVMVVLKLRDTRNRKAYNYQK